MDVGYHRPVVQEELLKASLVAEQRRNR
jgi:hypothetical protein